MSPHPLPAHVEVRTQYREQRLRSKGFESYGQYLGSPVWAEKRREYKRTRVWECICGEDAGLQLHHLSYERVGGDELLDDLEPLCSPCHALVHALERRGLISLDLSGLELDAERARMHRARIRAAEVRRERQRQAFYDLPLHVRLARLQSAQREHHGPIQNDLRSIEFMIRKAERKVDGARTGVDAFSARRQARLSDQLDQLERALTDAKPDALEDLLQ